MKHVSLLAAALLVLLANAFALIQVARNRSGPPEAEITLTDNDLSYRRDPDDSGVTLRLLWTNPYNRHVDAGRTQDAATETWLNRGKLEELGFDCSMDPADRNAPAFYSGQGARACYAALEYDGPAAQRLAAHRVPPTRLVVIDAGRDPAALRNRHPDRNRVVIVPAIIRVSVTPAWRPRDGRPEVPARRAGYIDDIPSLIHVPRPYSDGFRALRQTVRDPESDKPLYRVRLRYGSRLEPWVTGVEFPQR